MKNYTEITRKRSEKDKRKNKYILISLILVYIVFISLIYSVHVVKEINKLETIQISGNYNFLLYDVNNKDINKIKNNIQVADCGILTEKQQVNVNKEIFSIYSANSSLLEGILKGKIRLLKGSYPTSDKEIILSEKTFTLMGKEIGTTIEVGKESYRIVGVYEAIDNMEIGLEGIIGEGKNIENAKVFIKLKRDSLKQKFISEIEKLDENIKIQGNNEIVEYKQIDSIILVANILLIGIFVFLIYSTIQVKIKEKVRDVAFLRAIGCTKEKLVYMIAVESSKIVFIAMSIGTILGSIFSVEVVKKIILAIMRDSMRGIESNHIFFRSEFIIQIILATCIALIVSIGVAVIRSTYGVPQENLKNLDRKSVRSLKRGKFLKKLNYNVFLAYKSIYKNRKNFNRSIVILVLIISIFSIGTSYFYFAFKSIRGMYGIDGRVIENLNSDEGSVSSLKELSDYLQKENLIQDAEIFQEIRVEKIILGNGEIKEKNENVEEVDGKILINDAEFEIYSDADFNKLKEKIIGYKKSDKEDKENNIIILENNIKGYGLRRESKDVIGSKNKKLDMNMTLVDGKEVNINFNLLGTIKTENMKRFGFMDSSNGIRFIIPQSIAKKYNDFFKEAKNNTELNFNFKNKSAVDKGIKIIQESINKIGNNKLFYIDNIKAYHEDMIMLKATMAAGYIGMIFLILIVGLNITSNAWIEREARKKEDKILSIIGLSEKRFKRILLIEETIKFCIVFIIGSVASLVGITIIYAIFIYSQQINTNIPPYWIGILSNIIVLPINLINYIAAIKNIKNKDYL